MLLPKSFAILIALACSVPAQLSGSYTIDPAGTGPNNYTSFSNVIVDLAKKGMSGAVVFTVAKGKYVEDITIPPFKGLSTTNSLTFRSAQKHGAILSASSLGSACSSNP